MTDLQAAAEKIINAAIDAVKPEALIHRKVSLKDEILQIARTEFNLRDYRHIYLVGAGKASAFMAREMERILGDRLTAGQVTVKYGHGAACKFVRIAEAGHPLIDENSLSATGEILNLLKKAGEKDMVICLFSGGGSALLEKLPRGIGLADLQRVFERLLGCGADIGEINTVRKHLSLVKGGQLARAAAPAGCVSIILSDVIGDPPESIASGPTAPDPATFEDAWQVIRKYDLADSLPEAVRVYLQDGRKRRVPETLKPGDPVFAGVRNIILGNNLEALQAARSAAEAAGFQPLILTSRLQGEAREAAKVTAAVIQEIRATGLPVARPACILMGGETTVTLRGKGKGGRNQELALAALLALRNFDGDYLLVSCGTDGSDGPTDAAGGMASPAVLRRAAALGLDPADYLAENNAYPFLEQTGGLLKTGPTGTNVMDIVFALVP